MTVYDKEHYDLMATFERAYSGYRLDRELKMLWPDGHIYEDGEIYNDILKVMAFADEEMENLPEL